MKLWSTFHDYTLPSLPGISTTMLDFELCHVAIDLCEESKIQSVDLAAIDVVADTSTYDLESPLDQTEVSFIKAAWFNGRPLDPATLDTLASFNVDWATIESENSTAFTQFATDTMTLWPIPTTSYTGGLKILAGLRPTRTATGVTDWIGNDYYEVIANGAIGRCMSMLGKPWSNPEEGNRRTVMYEAGKTLATIDANRSLTRAALSVRMRPAVR